MLFSQIQQAPGPDFRKVGTSLSNQCGLIGACVVNRSKDGINIIFIFSDQERRIGRQQSC